MTRKDTQDLFPDLTPLKAKLGCPSLGDELLKRALTRKAYAKEKREAKLDREDLEDQVVLSALGDAVLKAIVNDKLTERLIAEGTKTLGKRDELGLRDIITKRRGEYEPREALGEIAPKLWVKKFLKTNESEKELEENPTILGETLEAVIGAIFAEKGYEETKEIVLRWPKFDRLQPI